MLLCFKKSTNYFMQYSKTYPKTDTKEMIKLQTLSLGQTSSPNVVMKMAEQMHEKRIPMLSAKVLCMSEQIESTKTS